MPNQVTRFRVGDRVQVAHAEHILATLDSNCRFEGLPFMPQMVPFCGQELTVTRWVNNVCYPVQGGADFGNLTNSVLLNVDRCDGSSFGGCQMACPLIWKTEWLSSTTSQNETTDGLNAPEAVKQLNDFAAANAMNSGLVTCQATQLHQITHSRNRLNVETVRRRSQLKSCLGNGTGNFVLRWDARSSHRQQAAHHWYPKTNSHLRSPTGSGRCGYRKVTVGHH